MADRPQEIRPPQPGANGRRSDARSGGTTDPEETVEALRRALLGTRARIRALEVRAAIRDLEGQAGAAPLPPAAVARLAALRAEAATVWQELLRVGREEVPPDPEGEVQPGGC